MFKRFNCAAFSMDALPKYLLEAIESIENHFMGLVDNISFIKAKLQSHKPRYYVSK